MNLAQFLVKAKTSTYVSQGEGGEKIINDGCKELTFKEKNLEYRDRYYGSNPFIGEEVIFKDNKAIWVMNYCGKVTSSEVDIKKPYGFLKEAMSNVKVERPFRGPTKHSKGDFIYNDSSKGIINKFIGMEKISYKGKCVYELTYHGCSIK